MNFGWCGTGTAGWHQSVSIPSSSSSSSSTSSSSSSSSSSLPDPSHSIVWNWSSAIREDGDIYALRQCSGSGPHWFGYPESGYAKAIRIRIQILTPWIWKINSFLHWFWSPNFSKKLFLLVTTSGSRMIFSDPNPTFKLVSDPYPDTKRIFLMSLT